MDPGQLLIVFVCLALGGVLKGATGAGAPVFAVPALAMLFDVQFAVLVMLVPNLIINLWQALRFGSQRLPAGFLWCFAGGGAAGVSAGTIALAAFPQEILSLVVAFAVLAYVLFRIARPGWFVPFATARRVCLPVGMMAGMLQGASGLSAPVSLTFLNAMRLDRPFFISTVSIFFVAMTSLQIPSLAALGILTFDSLLISTAALLPILAFMPVGAKLAKRLSKEVFDRVILSFLAVLAVKLMFDALL